MSVTPGVPGRSEEEGSGSPTSTGGLDEGEDSPIEPIPDAVREAARRAFDARRPGAVVADLVYDSVVDADRRADRDLYLRRLRFSAKGHGLDVAVQTRGAGLSATLTTLPPREATIEVSATGTGVSLKTRTDKHGRATVEVPNGVVSFVVTYAHDGDGAAMMQTAWVRL